MKAKRGAKGRGVTFFGPLLVVAVAICVVLCFFVQLGNLLLDDDSWNKELAENFLRFPLPADARDVEFGGRRGSGGKLEITFEASYESVDAFVSQFCGGTLYQGYDPFNAIDTSLNTTKEPPQGAYLITMEDFYPTSYYSYSPNTSDTLFGIRCLAIFGFTQSAGRAQIQILVDKTSPDAALVKIEALFTP